MVLTRHLFALFGIHTESQRRFSDSFFEKAAEIGRIGKLQAVADFIDRQRGGYQQLLASSIFCSLMNSPTGTDRDC